MIRRPPRSTLFSLHDALPIYALGQQHKHQVCQHLAQVNSAPINRGQHQTLQDRKSTRLNSSHLVISYAVFCLKTKIQSHECVTYSTSTRDHPASSPYTSP